MGIDRIDVLVVEKHRSSLWKKPKNRCCGPGFNSRRFHQQPPCEVHERFLVKDSNRVEAYRVATDIKKKCLAHAFVNARSAGFRLRVVRFDGQEHMPISPEASTINVEVYNGQVTRAWVV